MEISNTHLPLWIMAETGSGSMIKSLYTSSDGYLITAGIFSEEIILGDISLTEGLTYSNYIGVLNFDTYVGIEMEEVKKPSFIYTNQVLHCQVLSTGAKVEIYNMEGKQWLSENVNSFDIIDLSNLNAGIYLIKMYEGKQFYSEKIFIQ